MLLVCFAVAFIITALTRPAWDLKTTESIREGRDIVVLLDVSRSMLAEDVFPNRLESAKEAIIEFSEELNGDRISLVVFAGASQIFCPLSFDYAFFKNVVSEVDWQSASVGGTFVSEGLKKVAEDLLSVQKQADVDILVISDGGDMGNLDSLKNYIIDNDIQLTTIGVGNPNMGSLIPELSGNDKQTKSYVKHNGKPVTTTLEAASLKQIARLTGGNYVEAGINAMNLMEIYKKHQHTNTQKESKGSEITSFKEQFQWFLIFAIILLFVTLAIPRKIRNKTFSLLLFGLLIVAASCSSHQQDETNKTTRRITHHIKEGIEHYQKEEYSSARNAFTQAYENSTVKKSRALLAYNMANCYYKEAFNIVIDEEEEEEFDMNAFMLSQFIESERFYRIAINIDSSLQNAYFNFEVVRKAKLKLIEEMNRDEALNQEMDDPIREIIALLNMEKGIQAQLNKEVNALKANPFQRKRKKKQPQKKVIPNPASLKKYSEMQKQLKDTTIKVRDKVWQLEMRNDSMHNALNLVIDIDTIYQIPIQKLDSVFHLQDTLTNYIATKINHRKTTEYSKLTTDLLQETIDYFNDQFNQDPNMPEGKSEQDEEGEESEENSEESSSEYSESKSMSQSELNQGQEMSGFPPPNADAQDILNQEQKINKERGKKKSKYKSVEKDW